MGNVLQNNNQSRKSKGWCSKTTSDIDEPLQSNDNDKVDTIDIIEIKDIKTDMEDSSNKYKEDNINANSNISIVIDDIVDKIVVEDNANGIRNNVNFDLNTAEKNSIENLEITFDSENIASTLIDEEVVCLPVTSSIASNNSTSPYIKLLPHQHTLFCERKQRVCTAVGKLQELEVLKVEALDSIPESSVWIRISQMQFDHHKDLFSNDPNYISNNNIIESYHIIEDTENILEYKLSREDVGYYIGYRYKYNNYSDTEIISDANKTTQWKFLVADDYGLVLPGPPRLLEFTLIGSMQVGNYAMTQTNYIGGYEGSSEFWWMRINSETGCRTQITEPKRAPIVSDGTGQIVTYNHQISLASSTVSSDNVEQVDNDPRFYKLTNEDIGCYLKAKCRPVRTDGVSGEIFTSKSSNIITPMNILTTAVDENTPKVL